MGVSYVRVLVIFKGVCEGTQGSFTSMSRRRPAAGGIRTTGSAVSVNREVDFRTITPRLITTLNGNNHRRVGLLRQ